MRWDRSHESHDVEDRRGQSFGGGPGGIPLGGVVNLLSMFGWKGMLVGLVLAVVLGGGTCFGLGDGGCGGEVPTERATDHRVQSTPQEDELVRFVGYVFDDPFAAARYANVAAALATTGYGAVAPLPRAADVAAALAR